MITELFSRRNFVRSGLLGAGFTIIRKVSAHGVDCPENTLDIPSPMPLNDVLVDYNEVNKKYGEDLLKVTVCDKESWESKRLPCVYMLCH